MLLRRTMPVDNQLYDRLADTWWNDDSVLSLLRTSINPARFGYMRRVLTEELSDPNGRICLDVGCGGGLVAEPMRRLGADVVAIDASDRNIKTALAHAQAHRLDIDYRATTAEALAEAGERFDVILNMEVIEHVADPQAFVKDLAARLAPDGLLILSTPNRTAWSKLLTITLAEGFGQIPKGTHDFDKFIDPDTMRGLLAQAGLEVIDFEGIAMSPTRGLHLSEDLKLNYLVAARRAA
ncbi:MAG: bifunctional 2-polyprenyl-6-hydroxyphenol methylase/3-demethylubiquinol 3-O-methyltransferase UbiG [Sphingomicrobium sp.]